MFCHNEQCSKILLDINYFHIELHIHEFHIDLHIN